MYFEEILKHYKISIEEFIEEHLDNDNYKLLWYPYLFDHYSDPKNISDLVTVQKLLKRLEILGNSNNKNAFKSISRSLSLEGSNEADDPLIRTINASKQHVYFLIDKFRKSSVSIDNGMKKYSLELKKYKSRISNLNDDEFEEKLDQKVKIPNIQLLKNIHISNQGLFNFTVKGIQNGKMSLDILKNLVYLVSKENTSKLSSFAKKMIVLVKSHLERLPLEDIGMGIKLNSNNIYKEGFRILHGKPYWEKNLKSESLRKLGYTNKKQIITLISEAIDLYEKNKSNLLNIYKNTLEAQIQYYKVCDAIKDIISNKKDIDKRYISNVYYTATSAFYMIEVMGVKTRMWPNRELKYLWMLSKKIG